MDHFSHISYLELVVVACGFLIVIMTKYSLSEPHRLSNDSFSRGKYPKSNNDSSLSPSRRPSYSCSPRSGYSKRRGRRTFGIKHL